MENNKRFWDRAARFYRGIQERSNRDLYDAIVQNIKPWLGGSPRVLELACGSGQLTVPLCNQASRWEATDFSEKMISEAQKRRCSAHFSIADATELPYGNASFDVVIMANALHIMPMPEKALKEIQRVLIPGGIFLAPTFVYEGKVNQLRIRLTELVGFKTFHRWTSRELCTFVEDFGFTTEACHLVPGDPLPVVCPVFRK